MQRLRYGAVVVMVARYCNTVIFQMYEGGTLRNTQVLMASMSEVGGLGGLS